MFNKPDSSCVLQGIAAVMLKSGLQLKVIDIALLSNNGQQGSDELKIVMAYSFCTSTKILPGDRQIFFRKLN